MKIGDSLIFLDTSYNKTRGKISQGSLEKIGRTYFYVRIGHDLIKVEMGEDFPIVLQEYSGVLFDSQESYNSYIEHRNNLLKLQLVMFDVLTPDQVRRILEIIEE
jgi:hypothetical protein